MVGDPYADSSARGKKSSISFLSGIRGIQILLFRKRKSIGIQIPTLRNVAEHHKCGFDSLRNS